MATQHDEAGYLLGHTEEECMWQGTKPCGYPVVMDYDFHTQAAYPPLAVVDEYNRVIFELFTRTGRDPRDGSPAVVPL